MATYPKNRAEFLTWAEAHVDVFTSQAANIGLTAAQAIYVTDAQFPDKTQVPEAISQLTLGLAQELTTLAKALANH